MRVRAKGGHQVAARLLVGLVTALMTVVLVGPAAAKLRVSEDGPGYLHGGHPRYFQYDLSGPIAPGGTVSFQALVKRVRQKGKHEWVPKKVTSLRFAGLSVTCDDAPHTIDVSRDAVRVGVKNRNFSYQFPSFTASVEGKLRKHGEKATGQFRYGPSDPTGLTNCATDGPLSWAVELHDKRPCIYRWRKCG